MARNCWTIYGARARFSASWSEAGPYRLRIIPAVGVDFHACVLCPMLVRISRGWRRDPYTLKFQARYWGLGVCVHTPDRQQPVPAPAFFGCAETLERLNLTGFSGHGRMLNRI